MTITLAIQTEFNWWGLMIRIPQYRPSILLAVIAALALAILGLAVDVALGLPIGVVALLPCSLSLGVTLGALILEIIHERK